MYALLRVYCRLKYERALRLKSQCGHIENERKTAAFEFCDVQLIFMHYFVVDCYFFSGCNFPSDTERERPHESWHRPRPDLIVPLLMRKTLSTFFFIRAPYSFSVRLASIQVSQVAGVNAPTNKNKKKKRKILIKRICLTSLRRNRSHTEFHVFLFSFFFHYLQHYHIIMISPRT